MWKRDAFVAVCALVAVGVPGVGSAAPGMLSENQARSHGAAILRGSPYGETVAQAASRITSASRSQSDAGACAAPGREVWVLQIMVPATSEHAAISGPMTLDARTGKMICAGLPFLD
jgi:hypothetical protein